MANTDTLKTKLTNIANAIRSKSQKTDTLSLDDMVTEINSLGGMDWIEGGVTFNISVASGPTVSVRRHGNAVIVDLRFVPQQAITQGTKILTFNNGWTSNITGKMPAYLEADLGDIDTEAYLTMIHVDMYTGDGSIYAWNKINAYNIVCTSFGFEAQPLT